MERAVIVNAKQITPDLFGDTDIAGGIPSELRPSPSAGPVYFEGQLVLALSFQSSEDGSCNAVDTVRVNGVGIKGKPLDELCLWDALSDTWFTPSPSLQRYAGCDVVVVDGTAVYRGIVDTACDVTLVPGWNSVCTQINSRCFLRWKSRSS